jgi:hypothetical protein
VKAKNDQPNQFTKVTSAALCEYLTDRQLALVHLEFNHPLITPLLESLPDYRWELRAIAVMLCDALYEQGKIFAIPLVRFDKRSLDGSDYQSDYQGVFVIDNYSLYFENCDCLTADWKETSQCQTLTQDLTELVELMID